MGLLSWLAPEGYEDAQGFHYGKMPCCECGGSGDVLVGEVDSGEWYNICPVCEGSGIEPPAEETVHQIDPQSFLLALFIGVAITSLAIGLVWFWAMDGALR